MSHDRFFRLMAAAGFTAAALGAAPLAQAGQTCFSGFSGTVHYNFAASSAKFTTPGTHSMPGIVFGSLASCAGLSEWPLVGTVTVTSSATILAFRAMTVDASGCGAVDEIVSMPPSTLSGTLQLHNDRNNFSNSTAFSVSTCTAPPAAAAAAAAHPGPDAAGN
jgi:hypothetical protein